jgi:hypothetical protein
MLNQNDEIWKDVPFDYYIGHYQVSSYGRLCSLDRTLNYPNTDKKFYKGQIVKSKIYGKYLQVCLCVNSKRMYIHVH